MVEEAACSWIFAEFSFSISEVRWIICEVVVFSAVIWSSTSFWFVRACATVTAVRPPGRYGALELKDGRVTAFTEKPRGDGGLINGGFFILHPAVLDLIDGDHCSWEAEPLARLVTMDQLRAFEHDGFWQPMDTLREKNLLEGLWSSGKAPWKTWE